MKTRSPYTELLFNLSPSTNVTESLKTFGVNEQSTTAIAVRFIQGTDKDSSTFPDELKNSLNCLVVDFSVDSLVKESDLAAIKQIYKISDENRLEGEICVLIASKNI